MGKLFLIAFAVLILCSKGYAKYIVDKTETETCYESTEPNWDDIALTYDFQATPRCGLQKVNSLGAWPDCYQVTASLEYPYRKVSNLHILVALENAETPIFQEDKTVIVNQSETNHATAFSYNGYLQNEAIEQLKKKVARRRHVLDAFACDTKKP